jgi:peptidoglycan hydrolase-like protein with peptidoglycan-binding domain
MAGEPITGGSEGRAHSAHSSQLAERTRALIIVVVIALAAAAAGFFASQWVRSPAEVAAETAPPPASVITAPVEARVVEDTLVTRGTVGSMSTVNAIPSEAPAGVTTALITRIPVRAGARLAPGDVVVEISGQPTFFLPGPIPSYRDLGQGDTGPDVTQLQQALRKTGSHISDPPGRYGAETAAAVSALFNGHGYLPIGNGALPMSAVTYVDTDTSTVVVAKAKIGQNADNADIQLASGDMVVFVDTSAAASELIQEGAQVALTAELLDKTTTGTITSVANNGDGGRATITPDASLTADWAGQDIRVDIAGTGSKGKVLAVPVGAVSLDGGGSATVTVPNNGRERAVRVAVGATGDGYVQVTPTDANALRAGDRVVIGAG